MTFGESIKTCFGKYADFTGRASRSEIWWFILFTCLVNLALSRVSPIVGMIFGLAVFLPSIAAGARRLHDTNRTGWWQLLYILPIIGVIIVIVFLVLEGETTDNQYGEPPIIDYS
ncbi:DUF805 domain-containing protein [Methyloradius palustris]|uniref:DUF805 domain-containing protein n=1 Tax=Methyloradius palustris TaxID=2778876 RepID=A0A8D5JYY8_9PROT|nr:DUF805 domain-containing protein [Methyloradius palustris]BCM25152.1 hypothetical protein ZMTM_14110 [Methyloradius palustris]